MDMTDLWLSCSEAPLCSVCVCKHFLLSDSKFSRLTPMQFFSVICSIWAHSTARTDMPAEVMRWQDDKSIRCNSRLLFANSNQASIWYLRSIQWDWSQMATFQCQCIQTFICDIATLTQCNTLQVRTAKCKSCQKAVIDNTTVEYWQLVRS